jgi:Uma2 family endonuclease
MQDTIIHPPRTVMEVFKMLPEGTLAEVIDNNLYMSPTPVGRHQRILLDIASEMNSYVKATSSGSIYVAPFDVYLDETSNAVQPDILFISKENLKIVTEAGHVHGVPDLIIEILSPGNKKHDTVTKKELYQRFNVKEYWVVDPETKLATGYQLKDKMFVSLGDFKGEVRSSLLNKTFAF